MPELYFQEIPGPAGGDVLVLLHGLFGSSANWRGIAKRLGENRRILMMDMRNHGRSFHDPLMSYAHMAEDVLETLEKQNIERADILGHSMGGKAAMVAALNTPGRVNRLIVVDIAPVIYNHTHAPLIEAMTCLDVGALKSRAEADDKLKPVVQDQMTRQFLLQSLEKTEGGYRWRLNLPALKQGMQDLVGFPEFTGKIFDGPALFIHGVDSDYVKPEHRSHIERYFPRARHQAIEKAGHWVHVDQPEALIERVEEFFL